MRTDRSGKFAKRPFTNASRSVLRIANYAPHKPSLLCRIINRIPNIAVTFVSYPTERLTADNNCGVLEIPASRSSFTCARKVRTVARVHSPVVAAPSASDSPTAAVIKRNSQERANIACCDSQQT